MKHRLPLLTSLGVCALILAILLTACTTTPASTDEPTQGTTDIIMETPGEESTEAPTDAPTDTPTETPTEASTNPSSGDNALIVVHGEFETFCSYSPAHNVVSATYLGVADPIRGQFALSFRIEKTHMGLDMPEEIRAVYFPANDPFSTDPKLVTYEVGKTYLIPLERYRSVYHEHGQDEFVVTGSFLLIPTDDFQSATMYGKPLAQYVTGMEITEKTSLEEFTDYLVGLYKGTKDHYGDDFIHSTDLTEVITQSHNVYAVTVESVTSDLSVLTVTLRCRVDKIYKGDEPKADYVNIMFPLDAKVEIGDSFIVALNESKGNVDSWYTYAAPNSMYPLSDAEVIQAIIAEAGE